jgi:PREDICTED: hypothetical protein
MDVSQREGFMNNVEMRRFAGKQWRKNFLTFFAAFILLLAVYLGIAIAFSFVLSPSLVLTLSSLQEGIQYGLNLSISGILLALFLCVLLLYLVITSFSFLYMALKLTRGETITPFDIFYTLNLKNFPMQRSLIGYTFLYLILPWGLNALFIFFFGFSMKNPVLNFLEEATFHIGIGTFLLFYLCVPFLILERKAVSLKDAMQKSVAMMQKEWKLFLRQVLFFLVIRLGANLLASMWSYILDNSSFPDMLLSAFYVLYLSPCFILVQAKFYQEILKKNEILGRAETPEPEESVVTEQNRDASSVQEERNVVAEQEALSPSEEQHEAEEESAVTEQEQHALSQPEEVSTEWRDESVRETEELQQKEDIAEPKEENTEQEEEKAEKQEEEQSGKPEEEAVQEEEKVEKQEEKEEQAKEQAAKPEEKKEEELSFEEARKRYTDYKEES